MVNIYLGGVLIAVLLGLFGGWFITTIAYTDMPGAWMARRKTFKISAISFGLFYLAVHTLMFAWG